MGCKGESPYPYHVKSFSGPCSEFGLDHSVEHSNDSAISMVGQYIRTVLEQKAIPDSTARCLVFRWMNPVCLAPTDFDSIFAVTEVVEPIFYNPGKVDVAFPNGTRIRFCLDRAVYKLAGDSTDELACSKSHGTYQDWMARRIAECGR